RVDLVVCSLFGTEERRWYACSFQYVSKTLRLGTGIRMVGDIQEQEQRNALVLAHMRNRREVTMFCGIVTKLLTVTKLRLWQSMQATPSLRCFNDCRHVIGVPIDGYAAFDNGKGQALGPQIAIIGADQRSELGAGRMAHDE